MTRQMTVAILCGFLFIAGSAYAQIWTDDFEREEIGEDWTPVAWFENAPPDWSIENGVIEAHWPRWNAQMLFLEEYPSLDYTMQVKCRIDRIFRAHEHAGGAFIFRSSGPGAGPRDKITPFYSFGITTYRARFCIAPGGGWQYVGITPGKYNIGQWYTLKLVAKGDKFVGYVDDKPLCKLQDSRFRGKFVGLVMGSHTDASFDDFMITDQVDEDALLHFDVSPEGMLTTTWAGLKAQ